MKLADWFWLLLVILSVATSGCFILVLRKYPSVVRFINRAVHEGYGNHLDRPIIVVKE